jgi:DNA adenine methylase
VGLQEGTVDQVTLFKKHKMSYFFEKSDSRCSTKVYFTTDEMVRLDQPEKQVKGIVNVASVPKRSPFRYPGGKTWLIPTIRQWLQSKNPSTTDLIEPFAGGGIVSLTAVFEGYVERATLVEIDPDVAAVWKTILNGQAGWLASEIERFEVTDDSVRHRLCRNDNLSAREHAFRTLLRNRINRGGILAPGAGKVKRGENGRGLNSRWYPTTLSNRIREISKRRSQFSFEERDGLSFLIENRSKNDAIFFIDPPYTVTGRRLYTFSEIDHSALFACVQRLTGDFFMTYDASAEIKNLAHQFGFEVREILMKSTHHCRKTELLIGRQLGWLITNEPAFL